MAFPATEFNGLITSCDCEECTDIRRELRHRRWDEISTAFLDLTCGPTLLTPEAFKAFLPAYPLRALDDLTPGRVFLEFTVYNPCPNVAGDNEDRMSRLVLWARRMSTTQIETVGRFCCLCWRMPATPIRSAPSPPAVRKGMAVIA